MKQVIPLLRSGMGDEHLSSVASQKISEWLRTLFEPGQVIELRGIRHNGGSLSGIYDFEQFGIMAMNGMEATLSGNFKGVYYTLNPLKQESLATASRIRPHSASDIDVLCRRWLLIDVDPKRPSGHSATDEEKANAKAKIVAIRDHLRHQNWPEPVFADSGNGFHLLYRIDLPADDGGLVKKVLGVLADLFDNEHVEVDRKVFNPSRITKLYGTKACKGPDIPERPHRWTSIIEIPGEPQIASKELLESLVSTKPAVSKPSTQNKGHDAAPVTAAPSSATSTQKQNQARAYLAKIPGAIEGQDGDKQTFKVACYLVIDFDMSIEEAMPVLDEWNQRCVPPWSEKELRRKLEYADKKETKRGRLLANRIEPSKNTTMPADSANEIANVEGAFPVVIPDFFQWDKIQARPTLPVPCLDKLGRINKHPMLSREWVLDIVRHAVVAQRCSQVLLPDIYFAHLIWGCKDWPANWRQIIARALWNCAPDILPTSNQVDWTEDEEVSEIPDEKEWRRGELNCYQVCPFYGRHCAPHRHFRLTLPEESWGVMRSFVSETIQKNVVEFDFRNIKWTREEVKARKAKLKDELAKRREVMENPVFPDFDHFLAQAEFEAVEKEMNNIRVGGHRVKEVLAVYVLARIFGPSPHSGLTHLQCNILKALPMQLTRAPRNNDRADKALVVNVDSSDDPTTEYPVPVCPNLESGHFIMFNGNRAYRRYRHHGYGFKIATWMENAGYPSTAKYISFLRDLEHLQRDFGLAVFGWNRLDRQWRPLREMLSTCRTTIGRTWLDQCVLRIYATEDYLTRWRRYFAERLGFASIPGGEGENRRPEKKVKKQSRIVIQSASELQGWMTTQGLSDQRLADALGVNRATVSHYRTGYRRWSRKFQEKVALHIAGTQ